MGYPCLLPAESATGKTPCYLRLRCSIRRVSCPSINVEILQLCAYGPNTFRSRASMTFSELRPIGETKNAPRFISLPSNIREWYARKRLKFCTSWLPRTSDQSKGRGTACAPGLKILHRRLRTHALSPAASAGSPSNESRPIAYSGTAMFCISFT